MVDKAEYSNILGLDLGIIEVTAVYMLFFALGLFFRSVTEDDDVFLFVTLAGACITVFLTIFGGVL
jgi:hypothetical protein